MTRGIDLEPEPIIYSPVCSTCLHLHADELPRTRCDAFPEGIPPSVWRADNRHRRAVPGDHGIRYERGLPRGLE